MSRLDTPVSEKLEGFPQLPSSGADVATPATDSEKKLENFDSESAPSAEHENYKGEPIVTTGADVSRFIVDMRDDGDEPVTYRSFFIGTVIAGLGAALYEVC